MEVGRLLGQGDLDEFDSRRIVPNEFIEERFRRLARFAPGCVESDYDEVVFFVDDVMFVGGEGVDGLDRKGFVSSLLLLGGGGPLEEFGYKSSDDLFPFSIWLVVLAFFVVSFSFHWSHGGLYGHVERVRCGSTGGGEGRRFGDGGKG